MSTYYMKNKEEATNYCKKSVKSIVISNDWNYDLFLVGLYTNGERGLSHHIDTVKMNKRTV